jgi:hypothetical protein
MQSVRQNRRLQGAHVPRDDVPPGGTELDLDALSWAAWSPWELAPRLAAAGADAAGLRWGVAGGWAIDLFLGARGVREQTREHGDLEVAVPSSHFSRLRAALPELAFTVVGSDETGGGSYSWPVESPAFDVHYQTWGREPSTGQYRVDVFREPHDGDTWICRRDESIRRPYSAVYARTSDGIPYVVPEIVVLFKAKHGLPKDEADFAAVLPRLADGQRAWLHDALAVAHPGHVWLEQLA